MNLQATSVSHGPVAPRRRPLLAAAVLVAVTLLVCIPAMTGGFFWDDDVSLLHNPLIKAGDGLRRIWLTTEAMDYFPVTNSMFWLEWRIWGDHAAGYHIVNVLLHAAAAVLVWRVLRRLSVPGAWLAGMLFAVHPVAAASAAWITELKNTLSLVFCAASLLIFLDFDERAGPAFPRFQLFKYLLSLALFLLALLSKTSVVMLPVVLLLCAWWRRGRISRKDLLRSLPFLALSLAFGLVTIWFQQHNGIKGEIVHPEGLASRVAAAGWIAWFYLFKALLPANLCAVYPRWNVDGASVLAFVPLVLLPAGTAFLWAHRKTWGRAPLFALAYVLITLLPVLGFLDMSFMRYSLVADHLQYAAMIGVIAFAAAILARAGRESSGSAAPAEMRTRWTGAVAAAGCVTVLAFLSWGRASLYGDEMLQWRDTLSKNPDAWIAHNNLAAGLLDREAPNASPAARAAVCEEALLHLNAAIKLKKDFAAAYSNFGNVHLQMGRYEQAIEDYDKAVSLDKDFAGAYDDRGNADLQMGRYDQAIQDFDKAIAVDKHFASAYSNRGNVYLHMGRYEEAIRDFDKAIALDKNFAAAYGNRAAAHVHMGEYQLAVADCGRAILLQPDFATAWYNRGEAYCRMGRFDLAIPEFDNAIRLMPGYAEAYHDRAVAYYWLKRYEQAWADVKVCRQLGGKVNDAFLKALEQASGRME